jgi:hypothetical protein
MTAVYDRSRLPHVEPRVDSRRDGAGETNRSIHRASGRPGGSSRSIATRVARSASDRLFVQKGSFGRRAPHPAFKRADGGIVPRRLAEMPIELQPHFLRGRDGSVRRWAASAGAGRRVYRRRDQPRSEGNRRQGEKTCTTSGVFPSLPPLRAFRVPLLIVASGGASAPARRPIRPRIRRAYVHHWPGNVREPRTSCCGGDHDGSDDS